jgi:DNA-binding transcriptional MerR regulator
MSRTNRYLRDIPLPGLEGGPSGYRAPKVSKLVGISYRQLDYWTTCGLVSASVRDADGSGSQRLYSFADIVQLRVIKRLLDTGVSLTKIRAAIEHIRDRGLDLRHVTLVSDGKTVYALNDEREVVDLLHQGQGVFAIAVDPVIDQLEGEVAELEPERADPPVSRPFDASDLDAANG